MMNQFTHFSIFLLVQSCCASFSDYQKKKKETKSRNFGLSAKSEEENEMGVKHGPRTKAL